MKRNASQMVEVNLAGTWRCLSGDWDVRANGTEFVFQGYEEDDEGRNRSRDALYMSNISMRDGRFEAEVMVEEVVPRGTSAKLVFRYQQPRIYLMAGIGGWEFQFSVGESLEPDPTLGWTRWRSLDHFGHIKDIRPNEWYPIAVSFCGRDVELYHGETRVLSHSMPEQYSHWPAGDLGLKGFGLWKAHFRNVRAFKLVQKEDTSARLQEADVSCIRDVNLRGVAARDLEELKMLDAQVAPKSFVMLLGSIAEAALLDYLLRNEPAAEAEARSLSRPVRWPIRRWNLWTMIEVAKRLGGVGNETYATGHVLRQWRNWIHPARHEAQKLEPKPFQAVSALEFLLNLLEELA